jgi:hypothetical protein
LQYLEEDLGISQQPLTAEENIELMQLKDMHQKERKKQEDADKNDDSSEDSEGEDQLDNLPM